MSDRPPDRMTISLPPGFDLDREQLDDLVENSEFSSRSEFVREAIRDAIED